MLRRSAVVTLSILAFATPTRAQSAAEQTTAVRRAVLDYVEGFYEGDTTKLSRSIWKEVRKYGYWQNKPGEAYAGEAMSYAQIIQYGLDIKSGKSKTPANAPKEVVVFEVQDQTASAKVTAWWGTDYILLGKHDGKWMITQVLWQGPLKKQP